jgi:hypothetical protein
VVGADLTTWRQVTAQNVVFCVPGDWERRGIRWQGRRGFVQSTPGLADGARRPYSAVVQRGEVVPAIPSTGASGQSREFRETVDGRPATLSYYRDGPVLRTMAVFDPARETVLEGEASDVNAALEHIVVFRTLRFTRR